MLNLYLPLIYRYLRSCVLIFHDDVESSPTHRNDRSGSLNLIRIGLPAEFLYMYPNTADNNVQQLPQVADVVAEDDPGVRKDLKSAPVGNLENSVTVRATSDELL